MPCHPARARELLRDGKAAVYRRQPFTIILKHRAGGDSQPVELKTDPGSKTTGIAVVADFQRRGATVVWAAELHHRGQQIKDRLDKRRALRHGRRNRKTRYRKPRFLNRTRPVGWLPPSLMSRVLNVESWAKRLQQLIPLTSLATETVRFDTQAMEQPGISGVEYQQGTLAGYELREYLLEKWQRKCAYCDAKDIPLQVEHIQARANGGSNRLGNLTLACQPCNQAKGKQDVKEFLADRPQRLKKLLAQVQRPLNDAAAVNATRYATGNALKSLGLPVTFWSGGRTKFNRCQQGYPKAHWIDAAAVGPQGSAVRLSPDHKPLTITAKGRGSRQVVKTDKYGFPRGKAGRIKRVYGLQTGDLVRLNQPRGKYAGIHVGSIAGIRTTGTLDIQTVNQKISANWKNFQLLQRGNGYVYA